MNVCIYDWTGQEKQLPFLYLPQYTIMREHFERYLLSVSVILWGFFAITMSN